MYLNVVSDDLCRKIVQKLNCNDFYDIFLACALLGLIWYVPIND